MWLCASYWEAYNYAGQNPVMNTDPTGLDWWNPASWEFGDAFACRSAKALWAFYIAAAAPVCLTLTAPACVAALAAVATQYKITKDICGWDPNWGSIDGCIYDNVDACNGEVGDSFLGDPRSGGLVPPPSVQCTINGGGAGACLPETPSSTDVDRRPGLESPADVVVESPFTGRVDKLRHSGVRDIVNVR